MGNFNYKCPLCLGELFYLSSKDKNGSTENWDCKSCVFIYTKFFNYTISSEEYICYHFPDFEVRNQANRRSASYHIRGEGNKTFETFNGYIPYFSTIEELKNFILL